MLRKPYAAAAGSDTAVFVLLSSPFPGRLGPLRLEHGGVLGHHRVRLVAVEIGREAAMIARSLSI